MQWLALAFLVLTSFPGTASQEPTLPLPSTAVVPCAGCEGTGLVVEDCWVCIGTGKHDCHGCGTLPPAPLPRVRENWLPDAFRKLVQESFQRTFDKIATLKLNRVPRLKGAPDITDLKPGQVLCPAGCRSGKLAMKDEWIDCKACKKGRFDCVLCSKGRLPCLPCNKSGTLLSPCEDCVGLGELPNPVGMPASTCPWCEDTITRDCAACGTSGKAEQPCTKCANHGSVACTVCLGLRKAICQQCGGRGRYRDSKTKCRACRLKGLSKCSACKKGIVECTSCSSVARANACIQCSGQKQHNCTGCANGAYLAWERTAEWFLAQGSPKQASQWLSVGRTRCEERYAKVLKELEDPKIQGKLSDQLKPAFLAELNQELRRLDELAVRIKATQE